MTESTGARGRLAQMIASRGGLAPPEAPFVIEHREALIYMLCQAAELEHGIMCQYLYAAFSLKQSEAEGLTKSEAEAVQRWRKHISHIATQEMLHMSLVQNLLSAIGAAPHLSRPNYPQPASHYPAGVHLALLPFGEESLRHFMFLERPEGMDIEDAAGMAAFEKAAPATTPSMQHGDIVPRGQDFATVGHLYRSIEAGIANLAEIFGEQALFVGPPRAQATQGYFGWPELVAVTDVASAQRAVDEILEQGEGPRGHWKDSHFGQFVAILDEYLQLREANPAFDPVRPVIPVNVRPAERATDIPLAGDPVARRTMDLFNVSYEILLLMLQRFFAHTEETDPQLKALADATIALMFGALKPLGDLVTTLPAGPDYPGRTAGPSFELFYESDYVLPHREAAWVLLIERTPPGRRLLRARRPVRPRGDRRPARGPDQPGRDRRRPRRAPAGPLRPGTPGSGRGPRHPAGPCRRLLPNGPGFPRPRRPRARRGSRPADLRLPGGPGPPGRPPHPGPPRRQRPAPPSRNPPRPRHPAYLPPKNRRNPSRHSGTSPSPQPPCVPASPPGPARPARGSPRRCRTSRSAQAPAPERPQRLADLGQLQRELPPAVMTAKNGPYLVTNVTVLRTPLGEELPAPPQLALCRCGASALKPFCDGTHATSGFTDGKDPNRVPDQRDTYPGQQVTIFDNRGICQHSGLCRTGCRPRSAPAPSRSSRPAAAASTSSSGPYATARPAR